MDWEKNAEAAGETGGEHEERERRPQAASKGEETLRPRAGRNVRRQFESQRKLSLINFARTYLN